MQFFRFKYVIFHTINLLLYSRIHTRRRRDIRRSALGGIIIIIYVIIICRPTVLHIGIYNLVVTLYVVTGIVVTFVSVYKHFGSRH